VPELTTQARRLPRSSRSSTSRRCSLKPSRARLILARIHGVSLRPALRTSARYSRSAYRRFWPVDLPVISFLVVMLRRCPNHQGGLARVLTDELPHLLPAGSDRRLQPTSQAAPEHLNSGTFEFPKESTSTSSGSQRLPDAGPTQADRRSNSRFRTTTCATPKSSLEKPRAVVSSPPPAHRCRPPRKRLEALPQLAWPVLLILTRRQ